MSFASGDTIIFLEKISGETNEVYFTKGFIIAKGQPETDEDYYKLLKEANMKTSIEKYGCKY
jgi:hypothetical protein